MEEYEADKFIVAFSDYTQIALYDRKNKSHLAFHIPSGEKPVYSLRRILTPDG